MVFYCWTQSVEIHITPWFALLLLYSIFVALLRKLVALNMSEKKNKYKFDLAHHSCFSFLNFIHRFHWAPLVLGVAFWIVLILSPKLKAMPWLLARIRMWPMTVESALPNGFSTLKLARASSPNTERAYKLAAMNPQSPASAFSGVRHFMFVDLQQREQKQIYNLYIFFSNVFTNENIVKMKGKKLKKKNILPE